MNKIILSLIAISTLALSADYKSALHDSLAVADSCLSELEKSQERISRAELFSAEKVAAIMDTNNLLIAENQELKGKVHSLSEDNEKLKVEILSFSQKKQTINKVTKIIDEKTNKDAEPVATEVVPDSLAIVTVDKNDIHEHSKNLVKKYGNLSNAKLIENKLYRVPTYMLNIRYGHSSSFSISRVLNKNEIIEYTDVYKGISKDSETIWLKTKFGWMFVPNKKDTIQLARTYDKKTEKSVALSHYVGGEKG